MKRDSAKRDSAKRDSAKQDSAKRDSAKRDSAKRDGTGWTCVEETTHAEGFCGYSRDQKSGNS